MTDKQWVIVIILCMIGVFCINKKFFRKGGGE
jgi:hypothetical protein